jgi:TolB-like protein
VLIALGLGLVVSLSAAEKPKMMVLEFTSSGGVEPEVAAALSEAVTSEVAQRGFFDVMSAKEVQTLLGVERRKQVLGCAEQSSCLTELAGALGARFVLSGSVSKLGDAYQLALQALDSNRAQSMGRSTRLAQDLATLRNQIPYAVAEATGTPLPPPPSKALPITLMAVGGAALVAGGILGQDALSRERSINEELAYGSSTPGVLRTFSEYSQSQADVARNKTYALIALGVGAAVLTAGIVLLPSDAPKASTQVMASVGPSGVHVFGRWP